MNLGSSLYIYVHLCVSIGLWLTLSSATHDLLWLSILSIILLPFNLWRGWQKNRLPIIPIWSLLLICVAWLFYDKASLNSLLGVITLLTLSRLVTARRSHEYNQLLLLTFGQVIFASTLEFELSFGLALVAYMIVVTTALTLNHLHSEVERSVALRYAELSMEQRLLRLQQRLSSKSLLDKRFLLGVGAIASTLCIGAVFLFFLFPRVGGQWYQGYQVGPSRSGFSGDISLGGIGEIQLDDRVAFRVMLRKVSKHEPLEIAGQLPSIDNEIFDQNQDLAPLGPQELYWRGRVLDHYKNGRWRQSSSKIREIPQSATRWINFVGFKASQRQIMVQQFYLDSRGHNTLFHLGQAIAVSLPMNQVATPLKVNPDGDLLYDWPGDLHYAALSFHDPSPSNRKPKYVEGQKTLKLSKIEESKYLQLPDRLLKELNTYAQRVISTAQLSAQSKIPSPQEIAQVLTSHLKTQFTYNLEQSVAQPNSNRQAGQSLPKIDPILHFLQQSKSGHCEYFSTALTLLLRSVGIPARQVTGYAGGEWSELGAYYTVRQKDAHAWVEMWLGQDGESVQDQRAWLRLDPTPNQVSEVKSVSFFRRFNRFRDHMQFMWFRYVLGFDTRDQIRAVNQTRKQVKDSLKVFKQLNWLSRFKALWSIWWKESLLLLIALSFLIASPRLRYKVLISYQVYLRRLKLVIYQWWYKQEIKAQVHSNELEVNPQLQVWQGLINLELNHLYEELLQLCESLGLEINAQTTGSQLIDQLKVIDEHWYMIDVNPEIQMPNLSEQFRVLEALYLKLRFSRLAEADDFQTLNQQIKAFKQSVAQVKKHR